MIQFNVMTCHFVAFHTLQDTGDMQTPINHKFGITPEYPTHPIVLGLGLGIRVRNRIMVRD